MVTEIEEVKQEIDSVEQKIDSVEKKIDSVEQKIDSVEQKIDSVEQKINDVQELLFTAASENDVAMLQKKEELLREQKDRLVNDVAYLRKKEELLRKEKEDIRKKEDRLAQEKEDIRKEKLLLLTVATEEKLLLLKADSPAPKRHKTAYSNSIPVEDVGDEVLWVHEVEKGNVPCTTGHVDTLLDPERPLVADLRYLYLWHCARKYSVMDIVNMKRSRKRGEPDLERVYYRHALLIMEASAKGQPDVDVLGEDYTMGDGARADFRVYVGNREHPSEMKAVNGSSNVGSDVTGISSNKAAFGKLHRVIRAKLLKDDDGRTFLTTFLNRIECIWFARFEYGPDCRMTRCQVAPEIPAKGLTPLAQICPRLDDILTDYPGDNSVMLVDLLELEAPSGFRCLTRYIDTLCKMNGVPIIPVAFTNHDGVVLNMEKARIVARGGKSLIIQVGEENAVLKVGPVNSIENEYRNHCAVDLRAPSIRVVDGGVHGMVSGVEGLAFIKLKGLGKCISEISWEKLEEYWGAMEEALSGLHACSLLHRDVKPDNMLIIDNKLVLHDFDVSCLSHDSKQLQQYVGTPQFRSPYWTSTAGVCVPADDWISLALSFSWLLRLPTGDDPLSGLIKHPKTPPGMKSKIDAAIKLAKARNGDFLAAGLGL